MPDELEERLKSHARSFDSLLSLIPAKLYYGQDSSDQHLRTKQSAEQKRANKLAKLDPDNAKNAKDILDERAAEAGKKRKRAEDDNSDTHDIDHTSEQRREGLKVHDHKDKKRKQGKLVSQGESQEQAVDGDQSKKSKTAGKRERRRAERLKLEQKAARKSENKSKRQAQAAENGQASGEKIPGPRVKHAVDPEQVVSKQKSHDHGKPVEATVTVRETKAVPEAHQSDSSAPSSPEPPSLIHSPQLHSGTSSTTSIQTPSIHAAELDKKPIAVAEKLELTPINPISDLDQLTPQQRLESRIQALRAERKADGPDGRPIRNRHELLESRRQKEAERRAHKKEAVRKAKEEERKRQEEEVAKRFSPGGSASLLGSPRSPNSNAFSFSRVAFTDGTQATSDLSNLMDGHVKKGASDPSTALQAAQNKISRLAALDPAKRADIQEKDMWLNAKKRAHGEKIKDDTSLLKKALKRHEGKKGKSEKEWQGRIEGVERGMESRQRKRDENIEKRKGEKGGKGKGKGGKKPKLKRPGFEGSFKTRPSRPAGGAARK